MSASGSGRGEQADCPGAESKAVHVERCGAARYGGPIRNIPRSRNLRDLAGSTELRPRKQKQILTSHNFILFSQRVFHRVSPCAAAS